MREEITAVRKFDEKLAAFPRVKLACLPTPLREARDLGKILKGPRLFLKRDDLTGLALGGNKSRKLEFIIADALEKKAGAVVTWGGLQSNWCLQTAVAARLYGLVPVLILFKPEGLARIEYRGNLLLDRIAGARIEVREISGPRTSAPRDMALSVMDEIAAEVKKSGLNPYTVAVGGSYPGGSMARPLGALGYFTAFVEIQEQMKAAGVERYSLVHASGSGATQAGLLVAARACEADCRVVGISVGDPKEEFSRDVRFIAGELVDLLGLDLRLEDGDVIVFDDYIGGGYAVFGSREMRVISDVTAREGVFLDPVYTAKAMAGFLDLAEKGYFAGDEAVVFLHSGGTATLFAHGSEILGS